MNNRKNTKKSFFKIFSLIAYIVCTLVLIVEASINGETSSIQSNLIGDIIADIVNSVSKDQTTIIYPESIIIENKEYVMDYYVGEEITLDVKTLPDNSTYKQKNFTSSNVNIATVSNTGEVSFVSEGNVAIKVENTYDKTIFDTIEFNVKKVEATSINSYIENANIVNNVYTLYLEHESDYRLVNKIEPVNTTVKNVKYYLSSEDYLKVDEQGYLHNLKDSKGNITTIKIQCGEIYTEVKVEVTFKEKVDLENIELNISKDEIYVGEKIGYTIDYYPTNATYKKYLLESDDLSIIEINDKYIKGISPGDVTIKIQSSEYPDITYEKQIRVLEKEEVQSFDVSISHRDIAIGKKVKINLKNIMPNDYADLSSLSYYSMNDDIASVDNNGIITAKSVGSTNIVVKLENGFSQTLTVNVIEYEGYEKGSNITGFDLNTNEAKTIMVNESGKINLQDYYYVDKWIYDDSGNKNGSKTIDYVLEDGSKNKVINKTTLQVNELGETSFYVHHLGTNTYSEKITVNVIDSFAIKNSNDNAISKIDLFAGKTFEFHLSNVVDKDFTIQNYSLMLFDEKGNIINDDPIIKQIAKGKYEVKSISKEGKYTLKIIPVIYGEQVEIKAKEVVINVAHNYIDKIEFDLLDEIGKEFLIINNQLNINVGETAYFNMKVQDNVSRYNFDILSNNEQILQISNNEILAKHPGLATITIVENNTNLSYILNVKIQNIIDINKENPITMNGENITFDKDLNKYNITNGYSSTVYLNFNESSTYTKVSYQSSNEKIISVGEDGTLTPHKVGEATITLVCDDGQGQSVSYSIDVCVSKQNYITNLSEFFYKVRKALGHFGAFLVLGIFSTFTYLLMFNKRKWIISIPFNFISGFYIAFLTEFIQRYVPGRSGNFDDVLIDMSGFLISSIIITITILIMELIKTKNLKENIK